MKVSLSASHASNPDAMAMLRTCDLIYTTQAASLDALRAEFPQAQVRPLPDARNDLIEFLRARHAGDEVIEFSDLYDARRRSEQQPEGKPV